MASVARLKQSTVRVTSHYGARILNGRVNIHKGTDFAFGSNVGVSAFGDGHVTFAGRGTGPNYERGLYVQIRHAPGIETSYHSLSRATVKAGQTVSMGQVIGYGGMTAVGATGNHCHVGLWLNLNHVDLERFLTPGEIVAITNSGTVLGSAEGFSNVTPIDTPVSAPAPIEGDSEMQVVKNVGTGQFFAVKPGYIKALGSEKDAVLVSKIVSVKDEIHMLTDAEFRTFLAANRIPLVYATAEQLNVWGPKEGWWSEVEDSTNQARARHSELVALLKAK